MSFELNAQQAELVQLTHSWYKDPYKQTFEISGPAGSGKTSVVYELVKRLGLKSENVLYMAYVGKAAMMLALKGNFAKTIHGSIYDVVQVPRLDNDGNIIMNNGRPVTIFGFKKKEKLDPRIKLFVVDEGSMVNTPIGLDILSYGLPVIVLGDLCQLPPVFGEPFFLNNPDYILTEIMRQAKDNPIIKLSQMASRGERIQIGKYGDKCYVISKDQINDNLLKKSDIIICGKNETRQNINDYYRQNILGVKQHGVPIYGDKIICRQNNWKLSIQDNIYLINGLMGYIDHIYLDTYNKQSICIDFRPDFLNEEKFEKITMDYKYLFQPIQEAKNSSSRFNFFNRFQFAYAITAHLAQGSQYDNVLVYNERVGNFEYYCKWLYTALTRAKEGLVLAV